jgi:hypothetical protein
VGGIELKAGFDIENIIQVRRLNMQDINFSESNENKTEYRSSQEAGREPRRDRFEMRRRDTFRGLFPGLVLILLGVLLFAATRDWITWDIWWKYFLIGLGVVFLIDAGVHYLNPDSRHMVSGKIIPGVILIFVGIAFLYGFDEWWPLVLIGAGVVILGSFWFRRKNR